MVFGRVDEDDLVAEERLVADRAVTRRGANNAELQLAARHPVDDRLRVGDREVDRHLGVRLGELAEEHGDDRAARPRRCAQSELASQRALGLAGESLEQLSLLRQQVTGKNQARVTGKQPPPIGARPRSPTTGMPAVRPAGAVMVAPAPIARAAAASPTAKRDAEWELPGDNEVLPIAWSDNDITLFPGESQTLTATYNPSLLQGATPVVSIQGWNLTRFDVVA